MSADRLAEIKARIEAKLAEWPDFFHNVRSPLSAAETLWIIEQVEALTAERDALAEGRCMADTTLRDDEHRLVLCVLPDGHRAAHDDLLGTSWTDETHYDQSEVEVLGPVSAAPDLLAALMQSIEREKQRRRDAVPCDKCGGDRLRADFVNPDRCHAPTTEALADQWRRTAAEPAALRALIEWALADREARTHDLQGETLIPTWVIRDRADALKETL